MRTSRWILTGSAVVLVAASAVTRFAVYPAMHQMPADTESTFRYEGTASLLNAAALESGDLANAFLADLPVTLDRTVEVLDTSGGTAVVADDTVMRGPDGAELSTSERVWAVDRRDLEARPAPEGSDAQAHEGLIVSWPLEPEQRDYQFWDTGTQTAAPARYDGTETVAGRSAYVYAVEATGPLTDPTLTEGLPPALPRDAVAALATAALPAPQQPDPDALAALPETVPLTYTSTTERRAWIDTDTGLSLNGHLHQTVLAQTEGPDGPLTLFPVTDVEVQGTEAAMDSQADDAASAARLLWLLGTVTPLTLLTLAILLAALTLWLTRRDRRPSPTTDADATTPAT